MYSDPSGHSILAAIIIGAVIGGVVGGSIGGVAAYNSAKEAGVDGSNLFWATVSGIGKGALIGGATGSLVALTGGAIAEYGLTSIAATSMITTTATITAKATEVTILQAKNSINQKKKQLASCKRLHKLYI